MRLSVSEPSRLDRLEVLAEKNMIAIDKLTKDIDQQREESKEMGLRFGDYQQSTQAIVNLAFSLIADCQCNHFCLHYRCAEALGMGD
jgi:hypothetical protein